VLTSENEQDHEKYDQSHRYLDELSEIVSDVVNPTRVEIVTDFDSLFRWNRQHLDFYSTIRES